MACLQRGLLSAMQVRRAGLGTICPLSASSRHNRLSRVVVKAKQQDLRREPEPSQTVTSKFEWKEFEDAVEFKDLGRALKALEALNNFESDAAVAKDVVEVYENGDGNGSLRSESSKGTGTSYSPAFALPRTDYLKILDTCQSANDLELVGQAYGWLQAEGFLRNFGKCKSRGSLLAQLFTKNIPHRIIYDNWCKWSFFKNVQFEVDRWQGK